MKIDSHQHFWKYNTTDYVWMSDEHEPLKRDFLPEDLLPLLGKAGLTGSIAVQARQKVKETAWLLQLAGTHDFVRGVVGWLDLQSESLEAQLDEFAPHPKLLGVRHLIHDEPNDLFVKGEAFRHGISLLSERNLTYDLLLFPKHIAVSTELVDSFPEQQFVIDHIAKPQIKEGILSPWREDMAEIAKRENVFCKVSGMVTEATWNEWTAEDFFPYLDVVFNAFGPERIMIGSDWPVCTLSGAYPAVIGIVKKYLGSSDTTSRDQVLGGTCARFYGIDSATIS
ncbi:MAG: amidohydrolase [Spirochaetales bacterium]|nr:amidohydrolase [Spirochaetales bacterium]